MKRVKTEVAVTIVKYRTYEIEVPEEFNDDNADDADSLSEEIYNRLSKEFNDDDIDCLEWDYYTFEIQG